MIWEEGVINAPPRSLTPAVRTVSFLTDHQLDLSIRALQAAWLIDQAPIFWLMQGLITADSVEQAQSIFYTRHSTLILPSNRRGGGC